MMFLPKSTFVVLLTLCFQSVHSRVIRHTFKVEYISGSPDGVQINHIIGINGKFPGPTIEGFVGDQLEVEVQNHLNDGDDTTIHWHGFHQRNTPFEDGPEGITQCGIRTKQLYNFTLDRPGTYWYHSHVTSQYTAGLWGIIKVHNLPEVHASKYSGEFSITLNDWYHPHHNKSREAYLSPGGTLPFPDSVLLNGFGRYPCNIAAAKQLPCTLDAQRRPLLKLTLGKAYRVRLINVSGRSTFDVSIDSHTMEMIEVDGIDVKEMIVYGPQPEIVTIAAAQRYSFILKTPKDAKVGSTYLVRANAILPVPVPTAINPIPVLGQIEDLKTVTAVIEYVGGSENLNGYEQFSYAESISTPTKIPTERLDERILVPNGPIDPVGSAAPCKTIHLTIRTQVVNNVTHLTFDGKRFIQPAGSPLLARFMRGENLEVVPDLRTYNIESDEVVQLIIDSPGGAHPLHLHGHHFYVVANGPPNAGVYDRDTYIRNGYVYPIPILRDTVLVNANSAVVIQWKADNPGFWTFHCHIDWHMLAGMVINFAEGREKLNETMISAEAVRVCREKGVSILDG